MVSNAIPRLLCTLGLVASLGCGKPEAAPEVKPYEEGKATPLVKGPEVIPSEVGTAESVIPPPPVEVQQSKEGTTAAPAAAGPDLMEVDWKGFEGRIAEHKGKLVAVDAWASWCVPCREKFPKFVTLANEFSQKGVAFIGMNFDEPEEAETAKEFLAESKASFVNYRLTSELTAVQDSLEFEGLPRYFLYDAEGKVILNSNSIDELAEKIKALAKP